MIGCHFNRHVNGLPLAVLPAYDSRGVFASSLVVAWPLVRVTAYSTLSTLILVLVLGMTGITGTWKSEIMSVCLFCYFVSLFFC